MKLLATDFRQVGSSLPGCCPSPSGGRVHRRFVGVGGPLAGPSTSRQSARETGRSSGFVACRETGRPPLRWSSWRKPAGTLAIGNISEGNKAHGRTGGSGISDDAGALRTRRRSNASKVSALPACFGMLQAEHALKDRPGNGALQRGRWPRDLVRPRKWEGRRFGRRTAADGAMHRQVLGASASGNISGDATFGSCGSLGIHAVGPQDELGCNGRCGQHGHMRPHQPGDRRGEASCPARFMTGQVELVWVEGFPGLKLWSAVRR
jgi:hypothetical protein